MLPALEDISQGFGSMLVSAMDTRDLSRKQLAEHINAIGESELQALPEAQAAYEAKRADVQAEVARLALAVKEADELKYISARDVRDWEEEEKSISPKALDAVVKVLNSISPLDGDLEEELRKRAGEMNSAIESGNLEAYKQEKFRFNEFLKDLMDSDEYGLSRVQLAKEINKLNVGDPVLNASYEEAKALLGAMPEAFVGPQYSITVRKTSGSNELESLTVEPNQITSKHVHLLESGALPSDDLYALLKKGLSAKTELSAGEISDLDRTFAEKKQEVAAISAGSVVTLPTTANDNIATAPAQSTPAGVTMINPTGPAAIIPISSNGTGADHSGSNGTAGGLAARLGLKPTPHSERKPVLDLNDELGRYAVVYKRLFDDVGLPIPNTKPGLDGKDKRHAFAAAAISGTNDAKVHLTDAQLRIKEKLARHIYPLRFEKVPAEILAEIHNPALQKKLEEFNEASEALHDHIFNHSRQGRDSLTAKDDLKLWLRNHGIEGKEQIEKLNNNQTLEEMLDPTQLKKEVDIEKQMNHFAERVMELYPAIAEENGHRTPLEFSNFAKEATALQEYYNQAHHRFDEILEQLQKEPGVSRVSANGSY